MGIGRLNPLVVMFFGLHHFKSEVPIKVEGAIIADLNMPAQ